MCPIFGPKVTAEAQSGTMHLQMLQIEKMAMPEVI